MTSSRIPTPATATSNQTPASARAAAIETDEPLVSVIGSKGCKKAMAGYGIGVRTWPTLDAALAERHHVGVRLIIVQPGVGGHRGLETAIRTLRKELPLTDVVLWAASPTPETVRAAFRGGARDAVFGSAEELAGSVAATIDEQRILPRLERYDKRRQRKSRFEGMVSRSASMWDIFDLAVRVAPTPATVLILGETGTGKELLARAIHRRSGRKGRMVAVNCGAVPEQLFDAQLFGHARGAFTGAVGSKEGLFRRADGGTLFLDEIGNIPPSAQHSLLRVMQESVVRPVGSDEDHRVDVRLVAATNASLEDEIAAGRFREDLYYRLDVMRLEIPPLRARREDVLFLFGHFSERFARAYRTERPRPTEGFIEAMLEHRWPGNVRELENFAEKLTLVHAGERVAIEDFRNLMNPKAALSGDSRWPVAPDAGSRSLPEDAFDLPLDDASDVFERAYLERQLAHHHGRIGKTAAAIGVNRRTLLRKLTRHGIDKSRYRTPEDA